MYLVGAGPGAPELITVRGLALVRAADVVAHDALVHPDLVAEARPGAEVVSVGKRGYFPGSAAQDDIHTLLIDRARKGLAVVRLKGGDPFVFGRGGEEVEELTAAGVTVEVVPGVTTAAGAAASTRIPLTHRRVGPAVALVSGHNAPADAALDWPGLAKTGTVVFYMGLRHLAEIAAKLIDAGRAPATPAAVVERATLPDERVVVGTLATIADLAAAAGVQSPAVIIVGETVGMRAVGPG